jgi:hypothetical protein
MTLSRPRFGATQREIAPDREEHHCGQRQQIGAMKAALGQPLSEATSSVRSLVTPLKTAPGPRVTRRAEEESVMHMLDWNTYRQQLVAGVDGFGKLNPDIVTESGRPEGRSPR